MGDFIDTHIINKRLSVLYLIINLAFMALLLKMGYMYFFNGNKISKKALDLWSRDIPIVSKRGNIYDQEGKLIAGSILTPTVSAINKQITDKVYTARVLSDILECSYESIYKHLTKINSVEIIKPEGQKIPLDKALDIVRVGLDGIYVISDTTRYYPNDNTLAHTLGITGIDNQGITGLEYLYDDYLKGTSGKLGIYTDAKGLLLPNSYGIYDYPKASSDVTLTINLDCQLIMDRILLEAYEKYQALNALAIAINPKTGAIIAISSLPTFDILNYQDYTMEVINRNLPLFKAYEPGSTFKVLTYAAGLEESVFRLDEKYHDIGYKMVSGVRIKDWKAGGHGTQTFLEVIQNSCNPGFMEIGERLGVDRFYDYLLKFGYGSKTGVDLLGESKGILFKKSQIGPVELATSSFGQGNAVTPIQQVMATSAAINGGELLKPYIVDNIKLTSIDEVILQNKKEVVRQVISTSTSNLVKQSLESVVAKGTGRNAYIEGYRVGGKTGTAQKVDENGHYMQNNYIVSFIGAAPMNDPEIVLYVAIDNPKNTVQYGGVVSAPIVKMMLEEMLPILNVKKQYESQIEKELRWFIDSKYYQVPNYVGLTKKEVGVSQNYKIIYQGEGSKVISQSPAYKEHIKEGDTIILYLG